MGRPPKEISKEEVLKAIDGCFSIVSTVAKRLGVDWRTAKKFIDKWECTREAYQNEEETRKDFAEGKLSEKIKEGDIAAIKYFLSKKAKDRGYGDQIDGEISLSADKNLLQIEIVDPSSNA